MSQNLAQRAAVEIIEKEELTPDSVRPPLSDAQLLIPIRKHVRKRNPLALARIILAAPFPIDVNGFELRNGRELLREAAAHAILAEIYRQLFATADQSIPAGMVAASAG